MLAIGLAGAPAFAPARARPSSPASPAATSSPRRGSPASAAVRILLRHVLPNIAEPLVVNATIGAGGALLAFAGLSFLGLGVQPPAYDWGRLLYDGLGGDLRQPGGRAGPGHRRASSPGSRSTSSARPIAKGLGVGRRRTASALVPPTPAARRADVRGGRRARRPTRRRSDAGARRPRPRGHLPRAARPDPAGPRRLLRGRAAARRSASSGSPGSGKSLTALAVARLIEEPGRVDADAAALPRAPTCWRRHRAPQRHLLGTSLAMVFQDPMTSFNPTRRIGGQLAEVARHHQGLSRTAALARAVDRLRAVRIPDAGAAGAASTRTSSPAACASGR